MIRQICCQSGDSLRHRTILLRKVRWECFLGGYPLDDRLELAKTASPVHYIEQAKEVRPVLIMHGDKDEIVPFEQSLQFYEKMRAYGKDVRFYAGKFIYRHICDILVKNIG